MLKIGTDVIYTGANEDFKGKQAKVIATYNEKVQKYDVAKGREVEIPEDRMDYYISFAFDSGIDFGLNVSGNDIQLVI